MPSSDIAEHRYSLLIAKIISCLYKILYVSMCMYRRCTVLNNVRPVKYFGRYLSC